MLTCYRVEHERLPNNSNRPLLRSTGNQGSNRAQYPSPASYLRGKTPHRGVTFSADRCRVELDRSRAGPRSAVAPAGLRPGEDYAAAPAAGWSALVLCPCKPNRRMALPFLSGRVQIFGGLFPCRTRRGRRTRRAAPVARLLFDQAKMQNPKARVRALRGNSGTAVTIEVAIAEDHRRIAGNSN